MLKCICCKDHVHIVIGKGDIHERKPLEFGFPLFTQENITRIKEIYEDVFLADAARDTPPSNTEEFFEKILRRARKQSRDEKGHFTKPFLPKGHKGDGINPVYGWFEFVEGKSKCFEYRYDHPTMLCTILVPLYTCSLINYITRPPTKLTRAGYGQEEWEGKFELAQELEII